MRHDSVASIATASATAGPLPTGFPVQAPPGRLVFRKGSTLTLYEAARTQLLDLGATIVSVHATDDGSVLSALMDEGQAIGVWSYRPSTADTTRASVAVPRPTNDAWAVWTKDGLHAAYTPDTTAPATAVYVIDVNGGGQEVRVGQSGMYVYAMDWRTPDELTLMVGSGPTYPLSGASLFSWQRGQGLTQMLSNVRSAAGAFSWSPDGTALVYGDSDVPGGPPRLARRDAQGHSAVILSADGLRALPNGCDLDRAVLLYGPLRWSPDGARVALIGRIDPQCCYFLAIARADGGDPVLFRSPESCYLNDQVAWLDAETLITELTGPLCGRTTLEGRGIIIDARSGRAIGEVPVARKSELHVSPDGRWLASSADGGIDLTPLDQPAKRVTLPIPGTFVGWCCQ